jgi:CheY-like chemotaxis protein
VRVRILILDDNPERHKVFAGVLKREVLVHVFVAALQSQEPFDLVYLDHDLGDFAAADTYDDYGDGMYSGGSKREYTGADVAWFIARKLDQSKWPTRIIIHSWNPDGARRMRDTLQDAGLSCVCQPFGESFTFG